MQLIGLFHEAEHARYLIKYVQVNFRPGSLMIEAEPNTDSGIGSDTGSSHQGCIGPYACMLERELSSEWNIIRGDKYRSLGTLLEKKVIAKINPLLEKAKASDDEESLGNLVNDFFSLLFWSRAYNIVFQFEAYKPSNIRKRNQGLIETIDEYHPEVNVVGIAHAFALKKARPELNFTVLLVQNPRTIIELGLMGLYSKIYETRPDNLVFCPKDPELYPEYNPLYDGVGLRYERNKS